MHWKNGSREGKVEKVGVKCEKVRNVRFIMVDTK